MFDLYFMHCAIFFGFLLCFFVEKISCKKCKMVLKCFWWSKMLPLFC